MPTLIADRARETARNPVQTRVDDVLRSGRARNREERRAEREVAYGDHLKILLEEIRRASFSE
ncbi:MAG: hypothetical protein R3190_02590 [Thermoanaerobaculia bacterium]|nr:hypothetical protein [Thermoanaerobaculia bacterium]